MFRLKRHFKITSPFLKWFDVFCAVGIGMSVAHLSWIGVIVFGLLSASVDFAVAMMIRRHQLEGRVFKDAV